jgi:hypothetical protein
LKALQNKFCHFERVERRNFKFNNFSELYLIKFGNFSFFANFTERPLSFVERERVRVQKSESFRSLAWIIENQGKLKSAAEKK